MTDAHPLTCLTYHNIAPAVSPATAHLGATTTPDAFAHQLDYLLHHYTIVDLERMLSGDLPPRAALITFDDAYASVARVAAPMLKARGLPAVFFVNPGPIVDKTIPLDCLASLVMSRHGAIELARTVGCQGASFADVMGHVAHLDRQGRDRVKAHLLARIERSEAQIHADLGFFLTPADLAALADTRIEIANHTRTHVHCAPLDRAGLSHEIAGSKELIEALVKRPVRAFAFPWGRQHDATPAAMKVVRDSGHLATFLVHGRTNRQRPAPDIWYRLPINSETGPSLRVSLDVMPRVRELKARLVGSLRRPNRAA